MTDVIKRGKGRPKGSPNKGTELGRKTIYKTFSISALPEDYEKIKELAEKENLTISKLVVKKVLEK